MVYSWNEISTRNRITFDDAIKHSELYVTKEHAATIVSDALIARQQTWPLLNEDENFLSQWPSSFNSSSLSCSEYSRWQGTIRLNYIRNYRATHKGYFCWHLLNVKLTTFVWLFDNKKYIRCVTANYCWLIKNNPIIL